MEKINIYKKKLSKQNEIELKQDLIVPDSKQDIFQIKDQNFYCFFSKVEIQNGKIKIGGNADCYISYISSSEQVVGLQTIFNFDDSIEDDAILENMNLKYDIEIQKQEIKIINERKISISLTLKVSYEIYGIDTIELLNDFSDIDDVQINSKKINISSIVGVNSNIASIKEDIKIDNTDIVADILKVNTEIQNKEVKISHNKVLTKADLAVSITYLTQDERVCEANEKFPVMSFIEIENAREDNTCTTDYQVRNILINGNTSEDSFITLQMEYEIVCKAFESKEHEVISDLYSLKYNLDFTSKEIEISNDMDEKVETIRIVQNVVKKEALEGEEYSMVVYSVKKNDTLWDVSKKFNIKQESVINSNNLEEPYSLRTGEKIYIVR